MKDIEKNKVANALEEVEMSESEDYSLNDDRRVKVLSPGALVAKRFVRNRTAVTGLCILAFMFIFSFIGGLITPYSEDQRFYKNSTQSKTYAGVIENDTLRYALADERDEFTSIVQAQLVLALQKGNTEFSYEDITYTYEKVGEDFYSVYLDGENIGIAYKDIVNSSTGEEISYPIMYNALAAYTNDENTFTVDGTEYSIDEHGVVFDGDKEVSYISRYVVKPVNNDHLSRDFKERLEEAISDGNTEFVYTETDETQSTYTIVKDINTGGWNINRDTITMEYDRYSPPSLKHPLGTDSNGMDMLTRLMYGGRISLVIGFIVEIIALIIGVILGGLAGYFGKWVDMLVMRIVDVFYCIPSMPIIIILGAAMDALHVDPQIRMLYLMLILGFLSWPGIARMVRGQILSLREQEFMTATEACGIRTSRRIFRHLVPNVIPQLIVSCTMGLGSTILTEATLSFLGLGVKFPFASWGNIITGVDDAHVLTNYLFIWIPAGALLLLTVLAFNLVGDGLRDAFDPKMKR